MAAALLVLLFSPSPTAEEAEAAAARILSDEDYQKEIPDRVAPAPGPSSAPLRDDSPPYVPPAEAIETVASAIWWVGIGIVVALVVAWLVRELAAGRADVRPAPAPAVVHRPAAAAAPAPADPDALARAGRYADAIHAILLRVIAALGTARPSWTSREVAERAELAPGARTALGHLVLAVEASRFGGRATGEEGYRACREHGRVVLDAARRRA